MLVETLCKGFRQRQCAPSRYARNRNARTQRQQGNGQIKAADQRADAATHGDHAAQTRVAHRVERIMYGLPMPEACIVEQALLIDRRACL